MAIDKIDNHSDLAVERLLGQYKDKEKIEGLIRAVVNQYQDLEDGICTILERLSIPLSVGEALDLIGTIVNVDRNDLDDVAYRTALIAKIGQNTSRGVPEDIINIFLLSVETAWVQYQNHGNGNISLTGTMTFADQDEINRLFFTMQEAIAGGVRLTQIICADETEAFTYSPENPSAPGLGYDDGTMTVGGEYASSYSFLLPFAYDTEIDDPSTKGYGAGGLDPYVGGGYIEV